MRHRILDDLRRSVQDEALWMAMEVYMRLRRMVVELGTPKENIISFALVYFLEVFPLYSIFHPPCTLVADARVPMPLDLSL